MRDLNRVTLLGNLTRDPELRQISSGQSVATFTVATNRSWVTPTGERQDSVEFTDCVAWGKLAEIVGQILRKGGRVYVEGRLQSRSWEGQDGVKRQKTEVTISDFSSFDRSGGSSSVERADSNFPTESPAERDINQDAPQTPKADTSDEIDINDIPF